MKRWHIPLFVLAGAFCVIEITVGLVWAYQDSSTNFEKTFSDSGMISIVFVSMFLSVAAICAGKYLQRLYEKADSYLQPYEPKPLVRTTSEDVNLGETEALPSPETSSEDMHRDVGEAEPEPKEVGSWIRPPISPDVEDIVREYCMPVGNKIPSPTEPVSREDEGSSPYLKLETS